MRRSFWDDALSMSEHAYDEQWKEYRRLRLRHWLNIAGWYVVSILALIFLDRLIRFGWLSLVPVAAISLYFGIEYERFGKFLCPRCGNRFSSNWRGFRPFTKKCLYCGLIKFSDGE
jgi:hypothetical protein